MTVEQLGAMMGHATPDFTRLTLKNDLYGFVARFLDDQEEECDLLSTFKTKPLVYALIAMNWNLLYDECKYEVAYSLLVEHEPKTEEEFGKVLNMMIRLDDEVITEENLSNISGREN